MAKKTEFYSDYIIRVAPFQFLHVKDTNLNVVKIIQGPLTYTCLDHEKVVYGPVPMIVIPPDHYVVIENPVVFQKTERGLEVLTDEHGQPIHRYGDKEIRFTQPPFALHDGERAGHVTRLKLVENDTALKLRALRDFEDRYEKKPRKAGEEWLFVGRKVYYPQVEVEIVETRKAIVLKWNQALKIRATANCIDYEKVNRKAGEEWIVRKNGAYIPSVSEEVVEVITGHLLTDLNALHVRAKSTFVDSNNVERKAGAEWLVTSQTTELYIPQVNEEIVKEVNLMVLGPHDYCVIKDPYDVAEGENQLGGKKVMRGITSFFLQPGETLEGIKNSTLLASNQGLWLTATEEFIDTHGGRRTRRRPGDIWLCTGPGEYWPTLESKVQRNVTAAINIDALGIHVFQPGVDFGYLVAFLILYYFVTRYIL